MGGPKALLKLHGETLLQRAVRIAKTAGCEPVVAVIGAWDPGPLEGLDQWIRNPEAQEGMASSLRLGITALPEDAGAALLLTVDQVAVEGPLLKELLALAALDPTRPTACAYADTLGIPAVFPRRLFLELLALRGDRGAKSILLREKAATLPFPGGEADLDTPPDFAAVRR
jgi:molybdenum cofactor cytidylyltransferase